MQMKLRNVSVAEIKTRSRKHRWLSDFADSADFSDFADAADSIDTADAADALMLLTF